MSKERFIPPQNIEAEMSVLGGIFLDNAAIDTVHGLLAVDSFYRESHRKIFAAMSELADKNEPIDFVTLSTGLKAAKHLDEVGGGAYLAELVDYVPTAANISYYCKIVAGKAVARKVLSHVQSAMRAIYEDQPLAEAINELEQAINTPVARVSSEPVSVKDAVRAATRVIEQRSKSTGDIHGMPYGIPPLDRATDGVHRGDLIVIAARPSMGKTALALNVIESVCASGGGAIVHSLEMPRQKLIDRLLSSKGKIDHQEIRSGQFKANDWNAKLHGVANILHNWNLFIDDTPGVTLREVRSKARKLKKAGLDLVVVDYLQLMTVNSKENRTLAIGEVSRGLKNLARELDVAVILLSQLNRGLESRTDKRPVMSDLRDSGEVEQDADVIIFPFREGVYCQQCRDRVVDARHNFHIHQMKAEIIIEKQRDGERNVSIPVAWFGEYQRFQSIDG